MNTDYNGLLTNVNSTEKQDEDENVAIRQREKMKVIQAASEKRVMSVLDRNRNGKRRKAQPMGHGYMTLTTLALLEAKCQNRRSRRTWEKFDA
jgi:pantoate kinase